LFPGGDFPRADSTGLSRELLLELSLASRLKIPLIREVIVGFLTAGTGRLTSPFGAAAGVIGAPATGPFGFESKVSF
jgi:hypothetical protein